MEETRDDMIKEESEVESNLDNQNIGRNGREASLPGRVRGLHQTPLQARPRVPHQPRSRQVEDRGERERGKRVQVASLLLERDTYKRQSDIKSTIENQ